MKAILSIATCLFACFLLNSCCSLLRINCPPAPKAAFVGSPRTVQVGAAVSFTDQSTGSPQSWSWDLPGTRNQTSSEKNPQAVYDQIGTYKVSLEVRNDYGKDEEVKLGYITVLPTLDADFDATPRTVRSGNKVSFVDNSTGNPNSWDWTFQGGSPSTATGRNPQVTYNTPGTYMVRLQVRNAINSDTETKNGFITVTATPPPPPPIKTLVIEKVRVNKTPQSGTWLMCFMANASSGASNIFNEVNKTYSGDGILIPMNLELRNVKDGERISFKMYLDDDQADVCGDDAEDKHDGEFNVSSSGSKPISVDNWVYIVYWHTR